MLRGGSCFNERLEKRWASRFAMRRSSPMAGETKTGHDRENQEQGEVDGAGNLIATFEKLSQRLILKHNCKP